MDDSATRIEIALRAARLAKVSLEMMSLSPQLCRLQLVEVAKSLRELDMFLEKRGL